MSPVDCSWESPPGDPTVFPGEIHVWCAPLKLADADLEQLQPALCEDELERAGRYHFQRDRDRFIVCRARLRSILARYLNLEPAGLRFRYGPQGKPALDLPPGIKGIEFNVSNSQDLALFAIALGREVGVDLECVRPMEDLQQIAERFFAPEESREILGLPANQRLAAFFNCWTRKEATIKAMGTGLSFPLDRFRVSLLPQQPAELLAFDGDSRLAGKWWLASADPAPGYVGAVASQGQTPLLRKWRWP